MSILKVARMGHPVLRTKARPVTSAEMTSPRIQQLIDDMIETMREYSGIGLAAPRGRRLLAAVAQLTPGTGNARETGAARSYLEQRAAQIQELIDAADPAARVTVAEVLDRILAPIYLRQLFGYQPVTSVEQMVTDLLHQRQ